jgi:putative membrane protein
VTTGPTQVVEAGGDWQRLDRRMLLVHPVRELVRFLPVLIGLVIFGSSSSDGGVWGLIGVGIPVVLGFLRYFTTSYRLTPSRVELRHGLANKQVLSTPLDRVRTVDVTASPIHRLLGVVTLRIGTGHSGGKSDDRLALDGLSHEAAARLRSTLLHASASETSPPSPTGATGRVVLTLDPGWVRFAPLTTSGLVIAGATLGFLMQALRTVQVSVNVDADRFARLGLVVIVLVLAAAVLVALCILAVVGYVVTNFGFQLTQAPREGSWHLRRGLFTTRETTLDDARVSGVSIGEPLGLRLAHGGRLSAIVTGLDRRQRGSSVLVPPAPRREVDRVATEVLGRPGPVTAPLRTHGHRATRRRWTRAMVPALVVAVGLGFTAYAVTWGLLVLSAAVLLVGAGLALDRSRGLGHALVDGYLVARSGSLDRRREALATASVIGWNLRSTWFQRRVGLADLVATTAGGRQRVRVLDLGEGDAVRLARTATPGLLDQFLA